MQSLDDARPLEKLLSANDHELRVDAAESLARLGKSSGIAGLERLVYDPDPRVRRRAAAAMGEIADASFLPALIALLDDRADVRRSALASLPRVTGKSPPATDASATPTATNGAENDPRSVSAAEAADSPQDEARRWKQWYREQTTQR